MCLRLLIFPCTTKSKVLFWHRLTQVVPENGRKTVVVWCRGAEQSRPGLGPNSKGLGRVSIAATNKPTYVIQQMTILVPEYTMPLVVKKSNH